MKKLWISALLLGAVFSFGVLMHRSNSVAASGTLTDSEVIASVLKAAETTDINALPAIPAERFTLPPAGVDVMRVRMEETYTINGIGTDTVQLTGWIATKHGEARPAPGQTKVSWGTAVIDTEFVGLDLHGESKIFGPVHVTLSPNEPSFGQVGAIDVPELRAKLVAYKQTAQEPVEKCVANIKVNVDMPQLELKMKTLQAVRMYSLVETIPPVGHTASISLTPTPLFSGEREVGSLQRAEVKFREIVMKSPLKGTELASR